MTATKTLKAFMKKHGVTEKELVEATNTKNITKTFDDKLDISQACKIQKALGISAYKLLCVQLKEQIKKEMKNTKGVTKLNTNKHAKGQVDVRTYNALRRYEGQHNTKLTLKDLTNIDFLKQVNLLGPASISFIQECPRKYMR